MMVLVANNTGWAAGVLAGRFPGRLGHLFSPGAGRRPMLAPSYALDNGRFIATTQNKPWDEAAYLRLVEQFGADALWVLVPDVVADRDATLREWDLWAPRLGGLRLAIAVQDGMTPADIPSEASTIFVGGSTAWKWSSLATWCDVGRPIHVGRVNTGRWLWVCDRVGVRSCDGTGWFRGDDRQLAGLVRYLERSTACSGDGQPRLFAEAQA